MARIKLFFGNKASAGGGVSAALTGQGLTLAQGSLSAQVQSALSGQGLSLSQGAVVVEAGVTAALTGQSVTVAQGNVLSVVSSAITGQAIPIVQGAVVADVAQAITGQGLTLAIGSTIAAIEAPLVGQAVALAQGDVGIGGDIVRALAGQSLTLDQGSISVLAATNTFSQEVEIRKFYMRKGKKLLMFDSVSDAEAYTQAEALADEAIAKANKTSRLARKRLRTRIVSDALPAQTIDTDWLAEMMQRFAINLDLPALLAEQDYERVMQIHAMAMKMQDDDEDDIELLLMWS